jgi:phosphoadenosine phosphosulfate reductase
MNRKNLFESYNLIDIAIERLRTFEPPEGYYLAFSGGKDSICIKKIADIAGVKYDAHYNVTTIDPPDWEKPETPFLKEMVKRGFPQRHRRWCCEYLKEKGGAGRLVITGVRWAESMQRAKRKSVEHCTKDKSKIYINPIIEWTDDDVWEFIHMYKIPYCGLYDEGWKRIGCLFCPMAGKRRLIEANRFPKYRRAFIRYFQLLYDKKKSEGKTSVDRWKDGEEMFNWWISEEKSSDIPDQCVMFE